MARQLACAAAALSLLAVLSCAEGTLLDGEWDFALSAPAQTGKIMVPGSWEAQGYGNETVQMKHQVLTGDNARGKKGAVGVYSKSVVIEPCDEGGAAVFMVDRGIHRHALFKIAGKLVGEHTGYLTPFEVELSPSMVEDCCCGSSCKIEITLDGDRPCDAGGCSDALMGTADDDTDGTGLGGWAGLNGHVSVTCRPKVHIEQGIANVVPPHITHPEVTTASAGSPLAISVDFAISGGWANAAAHIFDNSTGTLVAVATTSAPQTGNVSLVANVPAVKLWSPEDRALYTVVVSIDGVGDNATTRFGVRSIKTEGYKLLLNGQRVFLAGYGDDAIYPDTVSPPREKAVYAARLKFAHEHGFNWVRHHSHVLPPEYFEAADEWGIMVSPELPCDCNTEPPYFANANATGQELYLASWASYVASLRNHPSIFDWSLCNEMYM